MKSITGNKTAKNSAAAQILKISQTQQEAYDNTEVNNSASYSVQRERERQTDRQTDRERPFCWTKVNSADPDQSPQNTASDQGLRCLITECYCKI